MQNEKPNKYQNGKIYKVIDIGYNVCYYGSTCSSLSLRMAMHRAHYKCFLKGTDHNRSVYSIFNQYGIENCKIELVKLFPCSSKIELEAEEGSFIKDYECVNKNRAGHLTALGKKEYQNEYQKGYRIANKDKIKQYYLAKKDKIHDRYIKNKNKKLELELEFENV
jgi:hypothetical protein